MSSRRIHFYYSRAKVLQYISRYNMQFKWKIKYLIYYTVQVPKIVSMNSYNSIDFGNVFTERPRDKLFYLFFWFIPVFITGFRPFNDSINTSTTSFREILVLQINITYYSCCFIFFSKTSDICVFGHECQSGVYTFICYCFSVRFFFHSIFYFFHFDCLIYLLKKKKKQKDQHCHCGDSSFTRFVYLHLLVTALNSKIIFELNGI